LPTENVFFQQKYFFKTQEVLYFLHVITLLLTEEMDVLAAAMYKKYLFPAFAT
jgi:hypothetical protein